MAPTLPEIVDNGSHPWPNENHSHDSGPADMFVCLCNGITDRDIRQTAEAGCRTMAELTMRTGCGAGCGSCVDMATALMEDVHAAQVSAAADVGGVRDVACAA